MSAKKDYLKNNGIVIIPNESFTGTMIYVIASEDVIIHPPAGAWITMVYPYDWSAMMTPWKCNEALEGMQDTGQGAEYADSFYDEVAAYVERGLDQPVTSRLLCGYSLGGIMALYMSYVTDYFDCAASVSGSMWYPKMQDYLINNVPSPRTRKYYFSLGDKESCTKNQLRKTVLDSTNRVYEYISGIREARLDINHGGHFTDIEGRIEKSIGWMM